MLPLTTRAESTDSQLILTYKTKPPGPICACMYQVRTVYSLLRPLSSVELTQEQKSEIKGLVGLTLTVSEHILVFAQRVFAQDCVILMAVH